MLYLKRHASAFMACKSCFPVLEKQKTAAGATTSSTIVLQTTFTSVVSWSVFEKYPLKTRGHSNA
jgi:hypothetical protein